MSGLLQTKYTIIDLSSMKIPHPLTSDDHGFLFNTDMSRIEVLYNLYWYGIFPWDSMGNIGSFYFPRKRYIIYPEKIKVPKSMRSYLNQSKYTVTFDQNFREVMMYCRHVKRNNQNGTWISDQFENSYLQLHEEGLAHSLEVWEDDYLVGGLYGVNVGKVFTGESMFSLTPNASRFALISLAKILSSLHFSFIDCQVINPYLESFGGEEISCESFFEKMKYNYFEESIVGNWGELKF